MFLLRLAPICQDREEKEQVFTEVRSHWSKREEKEQVFTEVDSHWSGRKLSLAAIGQDREETGTDFH